MIAKWVQEDVATLDNGRRKMWKHWTMGAGRCGNIGQPAK